MRSTLKFFKNWKNILQRGRWLSFIFCTIILLIIKYLNLKFNNYICQNYCCTINSRLKVMKYLLFKMLFLKIWCHYIMHRKETKVVMWSPHKNRFKKLILFLKNTMFGYKIIYLQKYCKNYRRMYANVYTVYTVYTVCHTGTSSTHLKEKLLFLRNL